MVGRNKGQGHNIYGFFALLLLGAYLASAGYFGISNQNRRIEKRDAEAIEKTMDTYDTNKDGRISTKELSKNCAPVLHAYDANKDGICRKELRKFYEDHSGEMPKPTERKW